MSVSCSRLRAVIVDDEPLARARLQRLLGAEPGVTVVAEFGDAVAAAGAIGQIEVDALFIDVRMPQMDGFALLERIPAGSRPDVVFVTAYSEHAVGAFDAHATDYLVKPVSAERLHESLQRVRARLQSQGAPEQAYPERLAVPDGLRMRMIAANEIEYVLAQGNYVELRANGKSYLLRDTMNGVAQRLDPKRFLRVHRSRIVRLDMIEQIEPYAAGQYVLRLRNGLRMTTGRSHRAAVLRACGIKP